MIKKFMSYINLLNIKISTILENNYHIILNLYNKLFSNYHINHFSWHIKIKLKEDIHCVKFYRTYPNNPYLNYNQYNDYQK